MTQSNEYTVSVRFKKLTDEQADEEIVEAFPADVKATIVDVGLIRVRHEVVAPHAGEAYRRAANHIKAVTKIGDIGPIRFRQGQVEEIGGGEWVVFDR